MQQVSRAVEQCTPPYSSSAYISDLPRLHDQVSLAFLTPRVTLNSVKNKKSVLPIYMKILLNHLHLIILVASFELEWPA